LVLRRENSLAGHVLTQILESFPNDPYLSDFVLSMAVTMADVSNQLAHLLKDYLVFKVKTLAKDAVNRLLKLLRYLLEAFQLLKNGQVFLIFDQALRQKVKGGAEH
jgi:hypothetical protein